MADYGKGKVRRSLFIDSHDLMGGVAVILSVVTLLKLVYRIRINFYGPSVRVWAHTTNPLSIIALVSR
jgi:hypothetical protein